MRRARTWDDLSPIEQMATWPEDERAAYVMGLSDEELLYLTYAWPMHARPSQLAPGGTEWLTWLLRAGRGFGKTRAGVGFVHGEATRVPYSCIALVAATAADARDYMIEGSGGFLDPRGKNIAPKERPHFEPSKRRLTWPNGSWATIYSDEEPDQLRGFSGRLAWIDELGKFNNPREVLMNLDFGMREASFDGTPPRKVLTLTPKVIGKANPVLRELEKRKTTVVTNGSSYENEANLDPTWFKNTIAVYEGTQTGREEIYGELLDPEETGIVKRSFFPLWPAKTRLPEFDLIVVSLDTAFTEDSRDRKTQEADPTACTVWGLFRHPKTKRPGIMLLDCWEDHLSFPDLLARAKKEMKTAYGTPSRPVVAALYGPTLPVTIAQGRKADILLIEDKGSGISLRQTLEREGLPSHAYNPGKASKIQRLHMVSHVFEKGFVWLVESETLTGKPKTWTEPLLAQLCTYVGAGSTEHDDYVDSTTQAIRVILDKQLFSISDLTEAVVDEHSIANMRSPYGRPLIEPKPPADNPYSA